MKTEFRILVQCVASLLLVQGTPARAEVTPPAPASIAAGDVLTAPPAPPEYRKWSFEFDTALLGNYRENAFRMNDGTRSGISTDLTLGVAFRRAITEWLSTGLRTTVYSSIAGIDARGEATAFAFPQTWTTRAQASQLFGQTFFRPWAELEAGLNVVLLDSVTESNGQFSYAQNGSFQVLARPASRLSIGFDVQPFNGSDRFFLSARGSYLLTSDFSNFQIALGTGFRL